MRFYRVERVAARTEQVYPEEDGGHIPLMDDEDQKECTPEPADPLTDLRYLENPVSCILNPDASLHDLTEAYSVLSTRLKSALTTDSVVDSTWPLFQPLRQHRVAFFEMVIRDLGRVHIDPLEALSSEGDPCPTRERASIIALPSPKESPRKKRGMSGEQAKFARDLCGVSTQSSDFSTLPSHFLRCISCTLLRFLLTNVLAIPMAPELPTPNARKTCALAVWLIQTMQLPAEVIEPAAPRIAYAIRRGIEGELGREGKKGAVSDGLKAIYELSTAFPDIFVPAFTDILPSLLTNLLAPTLVLRAQACHALGGFAYAVANIPASPIHARIAGIVARYLRPVDSPAPSPDANGNAAPPATPGSPKRDSAILGNPSREELRSQHWLHDLALYGLGILLCTINQSDCDDDEDMEGADEQERTPSVTSPVVHSKNAWKVMVSIIDVGAGSAVIASLLSQPSADELSLRRALGVLRAMSRKGGHTTKEALDAALDFLGVTDNSVDEAIEAPTLLPHGLFCAEPGLLTADWSTLPSAARPILEECFRTRSIRKLSEDELATPWVFNVLLVVFKNSLSALKLSWGVNCPMRITRGLTAWADEMTDLLIDLVDDPKLDVVKNSKGEHDSGFVPTSPERILGEALEKSSEKLLGYLLYHEEYLVEDLDEPDGVRMQWASLCAETMFACEVALMEKFWSGRHPKGRSLAGLQRYADWCGPPSSRNGATTPSIWEMGVIILSAPFMEFAVFEMWNHDVDIWNVLLRETMDRALDYGIDSVTVVDQIASTVFSHRSPTPSASSTRIADLLLSNLDINDARDVPKDVLDLVNDTLASTYPPEPRNKVISIWLIRTLTRVIDACPVELSMNMFELLQDGLASGSATTSGCSLRMICYGYSPSIPDGLARPSIAPRLRRTDRDTRTHRRVRLLRPRRQPEAITEAFAELWQTAYERIKEPSDGWSDRLQTCLHALAGDQPAAIAAFDNDDLPPSSDFSEFNDDLFASETADAESEEEDEVTASILPSSSGFGPPIPALIPLPASPVAGPSKFTTPPSTPKSTPPSSPSSPLAFPDSPQPAESPRAPMTPKRTSQMTPRRTPLSSARRRGEKENVEPLPVFATVAERIAMASPASGQSVLGKRPSAGDDGEEGMQTPKRARFDMSGAPLLEAGLRFAPEDALPLRAGASLLDVPSTPKRHATLPKSPRSLAEDLAASLSYSPEIPVLSARKSARGPAGVAFAALPSTPKRTTSVPKTPCPPPSEESEDDPFASCSQASSSAPSAGAPRSRKRKGVFMEAVEVPTFKEVLYREKKEAERKQISLRASLPRRAASPEDSETESGSTPAQASVRKTQSAVKVTEVEPVLFSLRDELPETPTKKRKSRGAVINGEAGQAGSSSMSSALRALRKAPILGSDDSIMHATPSKLPPKEPSSDDDPRLGQVNPVGLVSPALRRMKVRTPDLSDPLSSDDSVLSNSPSRELVKRRIARLPGSVDRRKTLNPSPLKTRPVSAIDLTRLEDD
ncbi:uncharacterized protein B0H18DRAFT_1206615 [Fomitopsis serialis]|uniref:uncharacterized protein n=1 Tax=Fomitopsis serialis TaxID=139415 RepID=UPI0020088320|nr:uncharacterized protein B0H18DRAFT_1206615 [Neoantrodia serialis]KAH9936222.1 hypothetical protein B0H18DRAFT_1206615 [Neoantrodia serialis]